MDSTDLFNSELMEEVFNEVECSEGSDSIASKNATKSKFFEDIVNSEKGISFSYKKNQKKDAYNFCKSLLEKSEIHEGLTDTSEDEDNKYFEETKFNECGRNLAKLFKNEAVSKLDGIKVSKTEDSWAKSKSSSENLVPEFCGKIKNRNELLRDPVLNMNIINPLVSSSALKEKLIGRISISTSKIKYFLKTPASKDSNWITGGAVVGKFTRTSQKGNPYCVWYVTDLNDDIKTICLYLFGSAYKEYWKTSLGTVVGILNPTVMENKEKFESTLRVDNAQKILVMGMSKDYGLCKSKKKNGENCLSVVNKSKCNFCVYHLKSEYNKACRRTDLQPPKIGRNPDNLKVKDRSFSQVLANRMFRDVKSAVGSLELNNSNQCEKDKRRMKLLSQSPMPISEWRKQKDKEVLKMLNPKNSESAAIENKNILPVLKPESQMMDLAFTITKKERNAAKANALKYIREHGSLKKVMDNDKSKRTPEHVSFIKRKLEEEEEKETKKLKTLNNTPSDPLKNKYLKNGITDEFLKLMNSKSQNGDLLKVAECEEREKYFNKLETKEKLENKMASTFKVECKAVRCFKCNYKTFSAAELCKKEKHPLKVVNAIKRFWKCGNCSARTVCLELVPLHSCKVCGSSKWERASMLAEKKNSNTTGIPLSLRGDEETFLGSGKKQAYLNLLVPEVS